MCVVRENEKRNFSRLCLKHLHDSDAFTKIGKLREGADVG